MVTAEPTEPPASGPAVEQPPHREDDRPRTTRYRRGQHYLWIYWPDRWQHCTVIARQDYQDGRVCYQVELYDDPVSHSMTVRLFAWGKDNVRPA